MNRRSFLTGMLKAGVAAAFLPGAGRLWKPTGLVAVTNPAWITAPYEVRFLTCAEFAHLLIHTDPWPIHVENVLRLHRGSNEG